MAEVDLSAARLDGARFDEARLTEVRAFGADLSRAGLTEAQRRAIRGGLDPAERGRAAFGHAAEASHPLDPGPGSGGDSRSRLLGGRGRDAEGAGAGDYRNEIEAIAFAVPCRAPRATPWPRIEGIIHAKIDAESVSSAAPIDAKGRYQVVFPYDLDGGFGGKATGPEGGALQRARLRDALHPARGRGGRRRPCPRGSGPPHHRRLGAQRGDGDAAEPQQRHAERDPHAIRDHDRLRG